MNSNEFNYTYYAANISNDFSVLIPLAPLIDYLN